MSRASWDAGESTVAIAGNLPVGLTRRLALMLRQLACFMAAF